MSRTKARTTAGSSIGLRGGRKIGVPNASKFLGSLQRLLPSDLLGPEQAAGDVLEVETR